MRNVGNEIDIIQMHVNEVRKMPLLSQNEEFELAKKAQAGDKASRDKLITSNMRFVIKIAKQYLHRGLEYEDLISEGYIGLMDAIDKFDVSKGYHFLSYAVWWIRQSILKALYDKVRPIRLPANRNNELIQIEKARHNIDSDNMTEEQELEQVASMLGMTKYHVREMLNISRDMVSLNRTFSDDNDTELMDTITDWTYENPEQFAMKESMKEEIENVLDTLDEKSAAVIRMRYGLGGAEVKSLQEIGVAFKLSKERIRQIEKKALVKLNSAERKSRLQVYTA